MLNGDRNTPYKDAELISVPMAAGSEIFAGAIVCTNATGFAVKGQTAIGLTYLGRADNHATNPGVDGATAVMVRRRKAFKFRNSGADPVGQASLGQPCYVVDDETVAATNGTSTRSAAGIVVGIESDGVWVEG